MSAKKHFEFGGPIGATCLIFLTTSTLYILSSMPSTIQWWFTKEWLDSLKNLKYFDPEAICFYAAWFSSLVLLWKIIPGKKVFGSPLNDTGDKLEYKMNGFYTFLIVMAGVFAAIFIKGPSIMLFFFDHFFGIQLTSYIFAVILCTYLYISSFSGEKQLTKGTQNVHIYDYWMGRELNPRIGKFDWKQFCELRPGMILWAILDVAFVCKSYVDSGNKLMDSIVLIWYIADSLVCESSILTTMDIATDGFGYMLSFGDLAWVPMTYSMQARYLATHPVHLGIIGVAGVLLVHFTGYYIFRAANSQKDKFRTNPAEQQKMTYIQTAQGNKLITSGYWGAARHINYLGDWLMSWAFCLPTGFHTPITYFYVIYFAVLLVHRERRDDEKCRKKYGADWDEYCRLVKYRIIPYVY